MTTRIDDLGMGAAFEKFQQADRMNRLRLGDAAEELLQIQYVIEDLPPSEQQTQLSQRSHALLQRMRDNVGPEMESLLRDRGNYVAWLRWDGDTFEMCDSDDEGAFRVYRQPLPEESRVTIPRDLARQLVEVCENGREDASELAANLNCMKGYERYDRRIEYHTKTAEMAEATLAKLKGMI